MGHHLDAIIGRSEVIDSIKHPGIRIVRLPQGFSLVPVPHSLVESLGEDLTVWEGLFALARLATGPLVAFMTDHFGGQGGNEVILFRDHDGRAIFDRSLNECLSALGVRRAMPQEEPYSPLMRLLFRAFGPPVKPLDEWDSLELGRYRNTEDVYEKAKRNAAAE